MDEVWNTEMNLHRNIVLKFGSKSEEIETGKVVIVCRAKMP